jgi:hypothetical protein
MLGALAVMHCRLTTVISDLSLTAITDSPKGRQCAEMPANWVVRKPHSLRSEQGVLNFRHPGRARWMVASSGEATP